MFAEIEFPTALAYRAEGGPGFLTTVNAGDSGWEGRIPNWTLALGKWKVELYHKPKSYFDRFYAYWLNMAGRANGFRFKDHKDFKATGQFIGVGDGATEDFQLQKTYTLGARSYTKPILKPITSEVLHFDGSACEDTVVIYIDGVPQVLGTDYDVDSATGWVSFAAAPLEDEIITADFEFHFPVRFDTDDCGALIEESDVAGGDAQVSWPQIPLVELRSPGESIFCAPLDLDLPEPDHLRALLYPTRIATFQGSVARQAAASGAVHCNEPGRGVLTTKHTSALSDSCWIQWSRFELPASIDPAKVDKIRSVVAGSYDVGVPGLGCWDTYWSFGYNAFNICSNWRGLHTGSSIVGQSAREFNFETAVCYAVLSGALLKTNTIPAEMRVSAVLLAVDYHE